MPKDRSSTSRPVATPRRRRASGGFSLVEVLLVGVVLTVALLGNASTVVTTHVLNQREEERGIALVTAERLVERLRADDDWQSLYSRLQAKTAESASDLSLSSRAVDLSLPTYAPTAYYADFQAPTSVGTLTVLVQVPSSVYAGVAALRENLSAPRYGLPADLNADGRVDPFSRNTDCAAMPVVVRARWQRPGRQAEEVVLSTWLRRRL